MYYLVFNETPNENIKIRVLNCTEWQLMRWINWKRYNIVFYLYCISYSIYCIYSTSVEYILVYVCVCMCAYASCGVVVRIPGYRSWGQGSIPGATRFSEKSGSGTVSTQPREYNWGATWKEK
jgi:hypothetical protein